LEGGGEPERKKSGSCEGGQAQSTQYHSVCLLVGIGTTPCTPSPASECAPPLGTKKGGGKPTRLRVGGGGVPIPTTIEKLSTLFTLWVLHPTTARIIFREYRMIYRGPSYHVVLCRVRPFRKNFFSLISEIKRIWIRFTCVSLFHYKISLLFFRLFSLQIFLFASL
jgi:hypothetical protein